MIFLIMLKFTFNIQQECNSPDAFGWCNILWKKLIFHQSSVPKWTSVWNNSPGFNKFKFKKGNIRLYNNCSFLLHCYWAIWVLLLLQELKELIKCCFLGTPFHGFKFGRHKFLRMFVLFKIPSVCFREFFLPLEYFDLINSKKFPFFPLSILV